MMKKYFLSIILLFLAVTNVSAGDTLSISNMNFEKELPGGSSIVNVDFPLGENKVLRKAVVDYIYECLQIFSGVKITYPPNTCDEPTFKAFLEKYTQALCQITADEQQEFVRSFSEEEVPYTMDWFSNLAILKATDTDKYVSYVFFWGEFCGGAHDNRGSSAITIRKSDGAWVINIFKEDVEDDMQPLLWKYLIASEEPEDEKEFVEEINKFLEANYGYRDFLHISQSSYLAPDGIHLIYDPQEISFWYMGTLEIIIPYQDARPFLTEEIIQLITGE